ncbi:Na+/H+ antiporter subunit E [Pengzhenrongella frigida]|uniref:Na+/H+ antiporter subunit E n=1 Tax=Pengzhenrongella frigida TaxID=1259133 RepID=A0A4Q5MZ08_9MICO|nr:Na+/H+ antiporter subunit E [Cellulomonas sp. HLT2-17]RYV50968.1 Na+/H+ antiporter subunit E [Cellulomonas sp. HLT2-17]
MSLHPRRRAVAVQWPTMLWLTIVWVLLWGDLRLGNVLAGLAIAFAVTVLLPLPAVASGGRLRPFGLIRLVAHFARDLVVASVQVGVQAFRPGPPVSAVIGVRLRSSSDLYLTLTAELCSLVPGSIVVEAHRLTRTLYLHVLDVDTAGGIEAARQSVLDQEERVLRAIASDAQLAAAGLGPVPAANRKRGVTT